MDNFEKNLEKLLEFIFKQTYYKIEINNFIIKKYNIKINDKYGSEICCQIKESKSNSLKSEIELRILDSAGFLNDIDGFPAKIFLNNKKISSIKHYCHGSEHCENYPAIISYDYKTNKPAMECWLQSGELHRIDGPAIIKYNEDCSIQQEFYYINGKEMDDLQIMILKEID